MSENGESQGLLKWVAVMAGGVIVTLWGLFGKEPCLIVPGIVVFAFGLVMLGITSGTFVRKTD